jgi:hypothetical protein
MISEFDAMLRILEQRPDMVVNTMPPPADQPGAMRLQRAAMLVPRALVPEPPRALALRTAAPGAIGIQAVMLVREVRPGSAATPPPPGPGAPKD